MIEKNTLQHLTTCSTGSRRAGTGGESQGVKSKRRMELMEKKQHFRRSSNPVPPPHGCEHVHPAISNPFEAQRRDTVPLLASSLTVEEMPHDTVTKLLQRLAGTRHLEDVTKLRLLVDSSELTMEDMWSELPSLHTLVLDGSKLASFRDLGVGLRQLHTLSLARSGIRDIDGISALSGLRELRMPHNQIGDLTPIACHEGLQVLDLANNSIGNMTSLELLGTVPLLYSLDLSDNPITLMLSKLPRDQGRRVVHYYVPQLRVLDGNQLTKESCSSVNDEVLEQASVLVCEEACQARITSQAGGRLKEDVPGAYSAHKNEVDRNEAGTGSRKELLNPATFFWDSELTQGGAQTFSGNPSTAIRRHKLQGGRKRVRDRSPNGVLETLDMARRIDADMGCKHNELSDRVAAWRLETSSDSLPHNHLSCGTSNVQSSSLLLDSSGHLENECKNTCVSPDINSLNGRGLTCSYKCGRIEAVGEEISRTAWHEGNRKNSGPERPGSSPAIGQCWKGCRTSQEVLRPSSAELPSTMGLCALARESMRRRPTLRGHSLKCCGHDSDTGDRMGDCRATCWLSDCVQEQPRRLQTTSDMQCNGSSNNIGESRLHEEAHRAWEVQEVASISPPLPTMLPTLKNYGDPLRGAGTGRHRTCTFNLRGQRRARATGRSMLVGEGSDSGSGGEDSEEDSSGEDTRAAMKQRAMAAVTPFSSESPAQHPSMPPSLTKGDCLLLEGAVGHCRTPAQGEGSQQANYMCRMCFEETNNSSSDCEEENSFAVARKADIAEDVENGSNRGRGARHTSSIQAGLRMGFDLQRSLAAIEKWTGSQDIAKDDSVASSVKAGAVLSGQRGTVGCGVRTMCTDQTTTISGNCRRDDNEAVLSVSRARDALGITKVESTRYTRRRLQRQRTTLETSEVIRNDGSCANGSNRRWSSIKSSTVGDLSLQRDEDGKKWHARNSRIPIAKGSTRVESPETETGNVEDEVSLYLLGPARDQQQIPAFEGDPKGGIVKCGIETTGVQRPQEPVQEMMLGPAVGMQDDELLHMLSMQPKSVPELRTRDSFRGFFRGMPADRMSRLLRGAFEGALPPEEAERKVEKRINLVNDMLVW